MADDVLQIERRARIALLTLNRPDRLNALSVELREALTHACQELPRTPPPTLYWPIAWYGG